MSIASLRSQLARYGCFAPEYVEKMLHDVPDAPVVVRREFILERCRGRVVLDIGATGPMHVKIVEVAKRCYGIDRMDGDGVVGVDLDRTESISVPSWNDVEVVVCGEVIEHLSNPGRFLDWLRATFPVPVIITVPNAFATVGRKHLAHGRECVNRDHVSYYSYQTLKTLLGRCGYTIKQFAWYNGEQRFAEGLIVVVE